jgi:hypothetical protein
MDRFLKKKKKKINCITRFIFYLKKKINDISEYHCIMPVIKMKLIKRTYMQKGLCQLLSHKFSQKNISVVFIDLLFMLE